MSARHASCWSSGSPPVTHTRFVGMGARRSSTRSTLQSSPPWNEYVVSHHEQRRLQPVSRTNVVGGPTVAPSPCTEWKISVRRRVVMGDNHPRLSQKRLAASIGRTTTYFLVPTDFAARSLGALSL